VSKNRVFIYGSCVARDTFEFLDHEQFELVRYVARQSAISAHTRPVTLAEPPTLDSAFQQRMVTGDFTSDLRDHISATGPITDLVLVDLTDERLGVYVLPDGSVVTRSLELVDSRAEANLPHGSVHIPFGSDRHFEYWCAGFRSVAAMFRAYMPRAGVALLDIPWAERTSDGKAAPPSFGLSPETANAILPGYVAFAAEALNAYTVAVDRSIVEADPEHPWGVAPFHYTRDVYLAAVALLTGDSDRKPGTSRDMTLERRPATEEGPSVAIASPTAEPPVSGFRNLDGPGSVVDRCMESLGIPQATLGPETLAVTANAETAEQVLETVRELPPGQRLLAFTRGLVRISHSGVRTQAVPATTDREYVLKVAGHLEKIRQANTPPPSTDRVDFPNRHEAYGSIADYKPLLDIPHTVQIMHGDVPYEFYANLRDNSRHLVVFGQSALVRARTPELPRFLRWSWLDDVPASGLVLNDPTLYLGDSLDAGWWVGTPDRDYVSEMVGIIDETRAALSLERKDVLFFGASAGGFSSLQMAACLPGSRALVDIPQTDLRRYHLRQHADAAVRTGLQVKDISAVPESLLHRVDVVERFKREGHVPQFTYIQNLRDSAHVESQMLHFVQQLSALPDGFRTNGRFLTYSRTHLVRGGHVPLDREATVAALRRELKEMESA
jgi:hypothetical protein